MLELALGVQWLPTRIETLENNRVRVWVKMTTTSNEIEELCDLHKLSDEHKTLAIALWSSKYQNRVFVNEGDVVLIRNADTGQTFNGF